MKAATPLVRISLGLVLITCSILLGLDMIGFLPLGSDELVESRIRLCETLAAQATVATERNDLATIRASLQIAVGRNEDVVSGGLRAAGGDLLVGVGDHAGLWQRDESSRPRATHVEVPLFRGGKPWATLEVLFANPVQGGILQQLWQRPLLRLVVFLAAACFVSYLLYMKRTLRHLDPSAVIPTRVQSTLDVMAEGVVLLDKAERIVLANAAFADSVGKKAGSLLGVHLSKLGWKSVDSAGASPWLPWVEAVASSETVSATLRLERSGEKRSFVVKGAPVLDGWGKARGAIATFDDVTELEQKTLELEESLAQLAKSEDEIRQQNEELKYLASHDPLTGASNRRFFMDQFGEAFTEAQGESRPISAVMADIDHFKQVNDTHGHQAGDEVIRRVSEALMLELRTGDNVCRYGGEEFCLILQETDIETAAMVAERLRKRIDTPGYTRIPVTVSFGVSSLGLGANSLEELIDQADRALYVSKNSGRNRVSRWDECKPAEGDDG